MANFICENEFKNKTFEEILRYCKSELLENLTEYNEHGSYDHFSIAESMGSIFGVSIQHCDTKEKVKELDKILENLINEKIKK